MYTSIATALPLTASWTAYTAGTTLSTITTTSLASSAVGVGLGLAIGSVLSFLPLVGYGIYKLVKRRKAKRNSAPAKPVSIKPPAVVMPQYNPVNSTPAESPAAPNVASHTKPPSPTKLPPAAGAQPAKPAPPKLFPSAQAAALDDLLISEAVGKLITGEDMKEYSAGNYTFSYPDANTLKYRDKTGSGEMTITKQNIISAVSNPGSAATTLRQYFYTSFKPKNYEKYKEFLSLPENVNTIKKIKTVFGDFIGLTKIENSDILSLNGLWDNTINIIPNPAAPDPNYDSLFRYLLLRKSSEKAQFEKKTDIADNLLAYFVKDNFEEEGGFFNPNSATHNTNLLKSLWTEYGDRRALKEKMLKDMSAQFDLIEHLVNNTNPVSVTT